jgi:hypothetical protein
MPTSAKTNKIREIYASYATGDEMTKDVDAILDNKFVGREQGLLARQNMWLFQQRMNQLKILYCFFITQKPQ